MKLVYAHGGDGNAVIPKNVDTHGRATIAIAVSGVVVTEIRILQCVFAPVGAPAGRTWPSFRPPR